MLILLVGASVAVSGCSVEATMNQASSGISSLFGGSYATEQSDPVCHAERASLIQHTEYFDKALVAGVLLGTLTGALTAGVQGGNVLRGAVIGGVSALAVGYVSKISGVGPYQALSTALSDVKEENKKLEEFNRSFRALKSCRQQEGKSVRLAFKKGEIDKATAELQMSQVAARHQEDLGKSKEVIETITTRSESYVTAYNEIAADNGYRGLKLREYRGGRKSVTRTGVPASQMEDRKEGSLVVSKAEKRDVGNLQQECITNVAKRDDCLDTLREAESTEFTL